MSGQSKDEKFLDSLLNTDCFSDDELRQQLRSEGIDVTALDAKVSGLLKAEEQKKKRRAQFKGGKGD
jgi:hypothetical protein